MKHANQRPPKPTAGLEITLVEPPTLPITSIERDPEVNCRAGGVIPNVVEQYKRAMFPTAEEQEKDGREPVVFPPVTVFRDPDGKCWLADGFHRCAAAEAGGATEIAVDVREGTRRDALHFAAGANKGARRTNGDKRRSVMALLNDPEWAQWSAGVVADHCGVSQPFVSAIKKSLSQNGSNSSAIKGKDGRVTKGPKRKVKRKLSADRALDLAMRAAQRGLDRLAKEWPREIDRMAFATTVEGWLAAFHRSAPTGEIEVAS